MDLADTLLKWLTKRSTSQTMLKYAFQNFIFAIIIPLRVSGYSNHISVQFFPDPVFMPAMIRCR
jgi:hypothetical protein